MARIPGRLSKITVTADPTVMTPVYTQVKGVVDLTLNINSAEIKTTAHDDQVFEQYIPGRMDGTLDIKLRYDEEDPGQEIVNDAAFNKTIMGVKLTMETGTGKRQYTCQGFPTKAAVAGPNDNEATYDVTLRLTGSFAQGTQT